VSANITVLHCVACCVTTEAGGGSVRSSSSERNYCHFELTDADRSDYFDRISELYDQQILCDLVLKVCAS
jgi:hypothetical protein